MSANKETTDLAETLLGVLRDAGWAVHNHGGGPTVGRMPEGVAVVVPVGFPVPESATVLCRELMLAGLAPDTHGDQTARVRQQSAAASVPKALVGASLAAG